MLKPIEHGTERGAKAHRRRGVPMCSECLRAERAEAARRARERYRQNPERERARKVAAYWQDPAGHRARRMASHRRVNQRRRRGAMWEVLADHLEALEMQWGGAVPMAVVIDSALGRHPDMNESSLRRVFHRMVSDGLIDVRPGVDERRYRLTTNRPAG